MRRRSLLNLLLVVVVAGLVALLVLDRETQVVSRPITNLTRAAIERVELRFPGAASIVLVRRDHGWWLTEPVTARADGPTVAQILRLAEADSQQTRAADAVDAGAVGLDPPVVTVGFNQAPAIALGDAAALARNRYARIGDTVYLIDEPNMRALDAAYANLVGRDLVPDEANIIKLQLPTATLTRSATGGWAVAPNSADRGADAAQATIDAWRFARALWTKPAGDEPAQGRVTIHTQDGRIIYEVVAREPQLILRRPDLGVVFHVAANQGAPLLDMQHPLPEPKLKQESDIKLK